MVHSGPFDVFSMFLRQTEKILQASEVENFIFFEKKKFENFQKK